MISFAFKQLLTVRPDTSQNANINIVHKVFDGWARWNKNAMVKCSIFRNQHMTNQTDVFLIQTAFDG